MTCVYLQKKLRMKLLENYSLLAYNTFGIDVSARYFFEYQSSDELVEFLKSNFLSDKSFFSLGGGSNVLFTKAYEGVILHSKIGGYELLRQDETTVYVKVGAGVVWDDFVAFCVSNNWFGVENLSLIPGMVGASPVQNIGAYGVEAKDVIDSVVGIDCCDYTQKTLTNEACCFGYRDSIFKHTLKDRFIVTQVVFKLSKEEKYNLEYGTIKEELCKYPTVNLETVRQAIIAIREAKLPDPKKVGNAGSFFKNPVIITEKFKLIQKQYPDMPFYDVSADYKKIPAAWLIEKSGWKGKAYGNAAVHDKQALVLINKGNASGKEVVELSNRICQSVKNLFEITITPEVIFL